jgi:hypothetical protein
VHVAVVLVVSPWRAAPVVVLAAHAPLELTFDVVAAPSEAASTGAARTDAAPMRARSRRPVRGVAHPAGPVSTTAADEAASVEIAPTEPSEPSAVTIDLSPRAVALAAAEGTAPADVPPSREAAIEVALDETLRAAAMTKQHLSTRPPPRLRHRRDGSYAYDGLGFEATIGPDGTVVFAERHARLQGPGIDEVTGELHLLRVPFDLNDEVMRARGDDPYAAERAWFLRETEALRDRMQDGALVREAGAVAGMLEPRLDRVWSSGGPGEARRRQLFELWDDCADDAVGAVARRAIEAFIRRCLPAGSADAYPAAEVAALNARRVTGTPFAPYAVR